MRVFEFLANATEKRPWVVVLCVVAITVFMAVGFTRLTTELSQEAMMPKDYESIKAFEEIDDAFGGVSFENALIVADDVTSPRIVRKLLEMTPENLEKEGIGEGHILGIETYLDAMKMQSEQTGEPLPSGNLMLGMAVSNFLSSPYAEQQVIGKTITEDEKAALIKFQVDPDLTQSEQIELVENLEEFLESSFMGSRVEVYLSGNASMQKDMQEFMMRESRILFLAAILFIMLILYLTYRRVSDIFLPLLIIVVGIQWVIGFMGWLGIAYTTMSVAILPLMLGINIAYVIHILSRYYEEREAGSNLFDAATNSVKTVGVAVFLTAITTMIGFGAFTMTDMPPMRDFGVVCVLGIGFSFLLSLTLLPATIVIRDRRKKSEKLDEHLKKMRRHRRDSRYGVLVDKALTGSSVAAFHHKWLIIGSLVVLIAVAGFFTFNLKTGADIRKMMPEDMPSVKASEEISDYFGPQMPDMLLVKGDVHDPENLQALLEAEDEIAADSRNSEIEDGSFERQGIFSIADLLISSNDGKIPDSSNAVKAAIDQLGKQMDLGTMITEDGDTAIVMLLSEFPETEDEMTIKTNILRDVAVETESESGMEIEATGFSVLISDLMGNLLPTQLKTSGIALLLCLLVLIIVFKSFYYGRATLIVVVIGIAAEIIMLFVLGWPLDMMTVTISALVIGVGVDFGIHITHRFREQLHHKEISVEDSIKSTVLHVGRSLVAAAFTTAGVFAILGISSMVPMRRFGWTVAVGLIAGLIGAVLVLPSLLAVIAKRREQKDGEAAEA